MVYSIGEALIDMIPEDNRPLRYVDCFLKQAGGAPANTAAAVAKLGGKAAFISKVGNDGFGRYLIDTLSASGVDVSRVSFAKDKSTGIIFVALDEDGEREFCSMRQNSADLYLSPDEIDPEWFNKEDILHFCSVSLVEAPVKYAHIKALDSIIKADGRVSFDINLRPMLWKSKEDLLFTIWDFMKYPDYLKVSGEEIKYIFDSDDYISAVRSFFDKGDRLKFIVISSGSDGSDIFMRDGKSYHQDAFKSEITDTTGAGDCFTGSVLYHLNKAVKEPALEDMKRVLKFASAASALAITKKGAMTSLPAYRDVTDFLNLCDKLS
ncbi:MAG: carbohydrate kinase family protein [Christensenellales bacterium]